MGIALLYVSRSSFRSTSPGEPSMPMDFVISSQCVLFTSSTNALLPQVAQNQEVLLAVDRVGVQGYDFVI
jgi:hypothetical protein